MKTTNNTTYNSTPTGSKTTSRHQSVNAAPKLTEGSEGYNLTSNIHTTTWPTAKTISGNSGDLERPGSFERMRGDHPAELNPQRSWLEFLMSALNFLVSFLGQAKKEKKKILTLINCFIVTLTFAGHETVTEVLKGENIKNATVLVADQYYRYPQTDFTTYSQGIAVKLYHNDIERVYRGYNWNLDVYYSIELKFNNGDTIYENGSLNLNYKTDEDLAIQNIAHTAYPGAAWAKLTVDSVKFQNTTNNPATTISTLTNDFHLELSAIAERIYHLNGSSAPTITQENYNTSDQTLQVKWGYLQGAESYDLEWVYVADGQDPDDNDPNTPDDHTTLAIPYSFQNATRVNITTNHYNIPMAYSKGSIIYRVRGIGYDHTNQENYPHNLKWASWSYQPTTFTIAQAATDNTGYYYHTGNNNDKNWTYTAVYAEKGKRKEVATFFDGSGRNRQQVTVQNTDNFAVVGETYYDYVGRGVINTLPTPVINQGVRFYGDATTPFNGTFGPANFATDAHLDATATTIPEALPSGAATANYYSSNNNLDFVNKHAIPVGDKYPYTFTQFTNDGTDRPKVQTGLGDKLKWQTSGAKNTRFFYSKPLQAEVDRLFGNEAGLEEYYQKVISLDPNGQQSVQYLDAKGRVIATALAGSAPEALDTLSNKKTETIYTRLFTSPKNVFGNRLIETYGFIPSALAPIQLTYNLATIQLESCYQNSGGGPLSAMDIVFNIDIGMQDEFGNTVDSDLHLYNKTSVTGQTHNYTELALKQYYLSRTITIDSAAKAQFLHREDSLLEVNKLTATCGPRYWVSADTICDTLNCDTACYNNYTYTLNDTLFYTDDEGNTYRPIGSNLYEWVEDKGSPKASWAQNNAAAPWNLEIDSCITACLEYKDTTGAADVRNFYATEECENLYTALLNDMSPGGQYLDNTPGDYVYSDTGTVTAISCDSIFCYQTSGNLEASHTYDTLAVIINPLASNADTLYYYNLTTGSSRELCIKDKLLASGYSINSVSNGTFTQLADLGSLGTTTYECYPQHPDTIPALDSACLADFNTNNGTSYSNWNDLLNNWQDTFATEIIECHPEYCAWKFFCNHSFSCNGNTYTMADLNEWLGDMHGAYTYTNGTNFTHKGTAYNFMNPLALNTANPSGTDKTTYIQETKRAADPLLACITTTASDFSTFANDSLTAYLTKFVQIINSSNQLTGEHMSIWYLLDDPDGIADANGGNNSAYGQSLIDMFNAIHGDGNCHTGVINNNDDKYRFFASIYTFLRKKVINDWFTNYYICPDGNLYTYWETDSNYDGITDTGNFVLRYPRNPLYDIYTQGPGSPLVDTIQNQLSGIQDNYVVTHRDTCTHQNFKNWTDSLDGAPLTLAQITDSLNDQFCFSYTTGFVDSLLNPQTHSSYHYMPFLPDTFICSPLSDSLLFSAAEDCSANKARLAKQEAQQRWEEDKAAYLDSLSAAYDRTAWDNLHLKENLVYKYSLGEYHYTLYYYDQAGNLVKTIPPQGVNTLDSANRKKVQDHRRDEINPFTVPDHDYVTLYTYNTQNQLIKQITPDGGQTQFWYDNAARLILSQNAKQAAYTTPRYSYTLYDGLSRVVESGEFTPSGSAIPWHDTIAQDPTDFENWISDGARTEVTFTLYDQALADLSGSGTSEQAIQDHFGKYGQRYLRNRVATTLYIESIAASTPYIIGNASTNYSSTTLSTYYASPHYENATHYSYDPHGNVEALVQDIPELDGAPWYRRFFKIDYQYDLVSGNVNQVSYQHGYNDAFYHRYLYDADNRIRQVETSVDGIIWEKDARYHYYPHGPLSRAEIGDQHLQGLDYAYTLQGWLKTVNGTSLGAEGTSTIGNFDIGQDAVNTTANPNQLFARDAMAFALYYFDGDYTHVGAANSTAPTNPILNSPFSILNSPNLYNGNITAMATALTDNTQTPLQVAANTYRYDQLNRITAYKSHTNSAMGTINTAASAPEMGNKAEYAYDANGNIQTLKRWKLHTLMDDFTYDYDLSSPDGKRNRLLHVDEAQTTTTVDNNDIDLFTATSNNYVYDEIGNLIQDKEEAMDISWMVNGKVKNIDRSASAGATLNFQYDALGNRIKKLVKPDVNVPANWVTTWYIRDAQGNVMATYKQDNTQNPTLTLKEQHLYGSDRLGMRTKETTTQDLGDINNTTFNINAWETYTVMPYGIITSINLNVSGDYVYTITALEEDISIPKGSSTPISGLYTTDATYYNLKKGGSITIANNGNQSLAIQSPFELTVSQNATLTNGSFTYISTSNSAHRMLGHKSYELKNHLGSVYTVISDRKMGIEDPSNTGTVAFYEPNVTTYSDYYPFGMPIGSRSDMGSTFRYGYQGSEKDNEIKGSGNSYSTFFRKYDPRIGRWLSPDPLSNDFPWQSPYVGMDNNPILFNDPFGNCTKCPKPDGQGNEEGESQSTYHVGEAKGDNGVKKWYWHAGGLRDGHGDETKPGWYSRSEYSHILGGVSLSLAHVNGDIKQAVSFPGTDTWYNFLDTRSISESSLTNIIDVINDSYGERIYNWENNHGSGRITPVNIEVDLILLTPALGKATGRIISSSGRLLGTFGKKLANAPKLAASFNPRAFGSEVVTVYHYTSKEAYKAITSSKNFLFKASTPGKGHPTGVYLTNMSPADLAKVTGGYKSKLGLTRDKSQYYFEFSIPKSELKSIKGGRGQHIFYHSENLTIPRSAVKHGKTP